MPVPAFLTACARWRWQLCALVATAFAVTSYPFPLDLRLFADAGRHLLGGHLDRVYDQDVVQAGPVQLVLSRLLSIGSDGDTPALAMRIGVDLLVVLAVRAVASRCRATPASQNTAAVMTALWLGPWGFWAGHPSEVLVIVCWLVAGHASVEERWLRAGAALTIAAAIAPWAVLGAPVLLVGGLAVALRAGAVAVTGALATYVPFVATGHFALFQHRWPIAPTTVVHLLDPSSAFLGWQARIVQALVVVTVCASTVVLLRAHTELAVVVTVLSTAAMRVVSDPLRFDYYWVPVGAAAIAAALLLSRRIGWPTLAALAYLPWFATTLSQTAPWITTGIGVGYVALLTALVVRAGGNRRAVAPRTAVVTA